MPDDSGRDFTDVSCGSLKDLDLLVAAAQELLLFLVSKSFKKS